MLSNLLLILLILVAVALTITAFVVADGILIFLKFGFLFTLLWTLMFGLSVLVAGVGGTAGVVIDIAVLLGFTAVAVWAGSRLAVFGKARRHPERYMIADKICGVCERAIMPDPFDPDAYEHIYKPAAAHELLAVDGRPDLLDDPEIQRRLAELHEGNSHA